MKATALVIAILACVGSLRAQTFTLQPGPETGKDLWTTSVYSYAPGGSFPGGGKEEAGLRVGGWADLYYSLIQFDLSSIPRHADSAVVRFYECTGLQITSPDTIDNGEGDGATQMNLAAMTSPWDWRTMGTGRDHDRLWWADQPSAVQWGGILPAPGRDAWDQIDMTDLYDAWQSGEMPNYGIEPQPLQNWNNWDTFFSSNYMADPSLRPELMVTIPEPTVYATLVSVIVLAGMSCRLASRRS